MEIFNIGVPELLIILIIMFILLGPKDMIQTAQKVGQWVRNFVRSPMWREIMGYSQEIRELPKKIMDETGLQETLDEVRQSTKAAADELNATLKEAKDEAQIPADDLRLRIGTEDENHKIAPPTPGELELASAAALPYEPKDQSGAGPAALDVAETAGTETTEAAVKPVKKPRKPRTPKQTAPAAEVNAIPLDGVGTPLDGVGTPLDGGGTSLDSGVVTYPVPEPAHGSTNGATHSPAAVEPLEQEAAPALVEAKPRRARKAREPRAAATGTSETPHPSDAGPEERIQPPQQSQDPDAA